jgi:hypothetical protein
MTIRQTAALGILSEKRLRDMLKARRLPGIYSGNRFLVNVNALEKQLEAESIAQAKGAIKND